MKSRDGVTSGEGRKKHAFGQCVYTGKESFGARAKCRSDVGERRKGGRICLEYVKREYFACAARKSGARWSKDSL